LFGQGIVSALYDSTVDINDSDGATIDFNDNWVGDPDAGEIVALGLNPVVHRVAALEVTLPPGSYTVALRGTGVEVPLSGVALIEGYPIR
jgi:hypothetical protein